MQPNRENFKARAFALLTEDAKRLTERERNELWRIFMSAETITAAEGATVNRIADRVRGVVA